MPYFANTPEAQLGRTDSLDPDTTCRGITNSGKPCRRSLLSDDGKSRPKRSKKNSNAANDATNPDNYCWQHKDQAAAAAAAAAATPPKKTYITSIQGRTSIDTLAERLGLMRTDSIRPSWPGFSRPTKTDESKPRSLTLCCCFHVPIPFDDIEPQPRPRPQSSQGASSRPSGKKTSAKRKDLIPPDLPAETAAQLQLELAKPISEQDEPGYIYIFWLTPESESTTPPREAARSLLSPLGGSSSSGTAQRLSDALATFARVAGEDRDGKGGDGKKKTILLKIGRATNVQRRLNEWQRQCGYNLSLVRYYPYVPSSGRPASGNGTVVPRKMPHSHKVERLVHLELTGRGLRVMEREKCEACGREHKEWFQVEATREAVREVDRVIKRWSDWDEALGA
ncbi:hypothetical protein VTJ04DRAFT_7706 [Mycothermus thermophilus]|uniref:uncharacterized protein n=1 Tax=Humicola insolens TaxID=85995 RepID=UPI00374202AE